MLKRNDTNLCFMPMLVTACCVLHNLCEVHGDGFNEYWMCEDDEVVSAITTAENIWIALCRYFA